MNLMVFRIRNDDFAGWADWDSAPHDGDSEFVAQVLNNPLATMERRGGDEVYFRPRFVSAWRDWDDKQARNNGRWRKLTELLRSDPELWVYVNQ